MKNLTVSRIALGNLKHRKKQYTIMIIGIVLAMVFSSSIVLLMFSASETFHQKALNQNGKQDIIVYLPGSNKDEYKKIEESEYVSSCGYAHYIGYAYPYDNRDDYMLGAEIGWLDDTAKALSYQTFLEGTYPVNENEIAAEQSVLARIGYKDAKVGDKIKLTIQIQNDNELLGFVDKEYVLTGIARDKKRFMDDGYNNGTNFADTMVAGFFVAQNSPVEAGGREKTVAYISYPEQSQKNYNDYIIKAFDYFSSINNSLETKENYAPHEGFTFNALSTVFARSELIYVVIAVLVFASCIAIINAFNTNLKERKKQIGMLRAVGTTKRQIISIFGREAFIISLIASPVSIAVSYFLVKAAMQIIADEPYMSKSLLVLPIAFVLNIAVVMLASLIPLASASKITPMQAIRNIENNRKMKTKKIKTQKSYEPSRLIAKRSLSFSKGSRIVVAIMLTASILLSCIGFSAMAYSKEHLSTLPSDYEMQSNYLGDNEYISFNYFNAPYADKIDIEGADTSEYKNYNKYPGFTENDRLNIASMPDIESVLGEKKLNVFLNIDSYTDYYKLLSGDGSVWTRNMNDFSYEEWKKTLFERDEQEEKDYQAVKEALNVKNEMLSVTLNSYEEEKLKALEKHVVDGKIDYDKLKSGEEVILIAPKKIQFILKETNHGFRTQKNYDKDIKPSKDEVATAEGNFKVGDMLDVTVALCSSEYDDLAEDNKYTVLDKNDKKVKIGAIISPNSTAGNEDFYLFDMALVTSNAGMKKLCPNLGYSRLHINALGDIDEEQNNAIKEDLQLYKDKYDCFFESNYDYVKMQKDDTASLIAVLIIVVVLGFVICAGIINNAITARIRENKTVIGTLRAVGADSKALSKVYLNEMLSMFSIGTFAGFGFYFVILLVVKIVTHYTGGNFEFKLEPWIGIGLTILLFATCSINLWLKVRKEMKNSIVENIREL